MSLVTAIHRDILRHRQKAAVLGVLLVVMAVFTVKAVIQLSPQAAAASAVNAGAGAPPGSEGAAGTSGDTTTAAEAEERIRESRELWKRLREVRGVDAAVAFSFDASFYPLDPARRVTTPTKLEVTPAAPVDDAEAVKVAHERLIREQAQQFRVQSTTMSGSQPFAVVNGQLVTVGGTINGFEVTAIRSRVVDFTKEGVPVPVKMPD